jgi:hypothetical protein
MLKVFSKYLILLVLIFVGCESATNKTEILNQEIKASDQNEIRISAPEKNSSEPAIASDSEGNIFVVYVEHEEKLADVYLQKFDKDAKQSGEKVRVNPKKGNATAWFGDAPTIKIGNENKIFIGWTAKVETAEKSNATALNLSVSHDGGKTFDAPVKVNDDSAPSSHGMHSLAIDKNNHVFMAWLDERNIKSKAHAQNFAGDQVIELQENLMPDNFRFIKAHEGENHNSSNKKTETPKPDHSEMKAENAEPNSEIFFAVSNDGGKTFSKNTKISSEVCPCCKTSLAVDGNGKIYASWRQVLPGEFRHIAVASSENNGEIFSDFTIVSDDKWQISACPVSGAPMFIDKNNNLKIFWYTAGEAGQPGLYSAESKDGGKSFLPRNLIYEGAVKGTLSVFVKNENDFSTFFDGMGKVFQADRNLKPEEKFAGELPSAIFTNDKTYLAFVKNGEKNSVWLAKF